jgi:PhnB protein
MEADRMTFKPAGYNSASPYLMVNGARATIAFLVAAFDAKPLRMIPGDGDRLKHGEVRIDDSVIMLADAIEGWPAIPSNVHVYVADVDATYARALKAGAISAQAPVQKDDADKRGGVTDPGGTTWWIGQQME